MRVMNNKIKRLERETIDKKFKESAKEERSKQKSVTRIV